MRPERPAEVSKIASSGPALAEMDLRALGAIVSHCAPFEHHPNTSPLNKRNENVPYIYIYTSVNACIYMHGVKRSRVM